jgi:hypothetical protein
MNERISKQAKAVHEDSAIGRFVYCSGHHKARGNWQGMGTNPSGGDSGSTSPPSIVTGSMS